MSRMKSFLTVRNAVIAIVAVLLLGAAVLAAPMALRGPRVVSITPADGARDVNPQAPLRIEFDQWVQADSVATALQLDPPAPFTVTGERNVVTIRAEGGLRYAAGYRLTLGGGVRNLLGRTMEQPLAVAFATVPYVGVGSVGPASGTTAVALNAPINVEFSVPVVAAEQVAAAAEDPRRAADMPQPLSFSPPVSGAGRWLSPTRYSFSPAGGWSAATTYTATIQEQITSDGRARLERPYSWSFTTGATVLAATQPFDGAAEVPADSAVTVRLARDVDVDSAARHFTLADESGAPVAGTVQTEQDSFLFKPAAPLRRGARYQATIAPGVQARSGAAINDAALSWSFTVIDDLAVEQVIPPVDASEVLTLTRQIAVRFNHPVVAVTTAADQATLPQPLSITPALAGQGRWLDTSTYVFSPTVALAPAVRYRVEVAAGLQDQTGGALRQPYSWSFSTITPQVYGSLPANDERFVSPRDPLSIVFNQPMDLGSLRGTITLRAADGAAVPGTVALASQPAEVRRADRPDEWAIISGFTVNFTPAAPLERGGRYTLAVDTSARAAGGAAALGRPYQAGFTVALPPALIGSQPASGQQDFNPNQSIRLSFAAPMDWPSVERNLVIEPQPTSIFTDTSANDLYLYLDLAPEADYRVTIGAAARDFTGAPLGEEVNLTFRTAPLEPSLSLIGAGRIGAYNAYAVARVPLQVVNVDSISYDLYRIERGQLSGVLAAAENEERWRNLRLDAPALKSDVVEPGVARNKVAITLLDLGRLDAGMYLLEARGAGWTERHLLAVSPYALTVKRSAGQLFVWAVDMASGQPVAGLPLAAATYSYDSSSLMAPADLGRTDGEGIARAAYSAGSPYAPLYVWSGEGARFAFNTTGWSNGIDPWSFSLSATAEPMTIAGSLSTDRPIYRPGELVHVRGVLRLDDDGRYRLPPAGQLAQLQITDPEGNAVYSTTLALGEFGSFSADFPLPLGGKLGSYRMSARLEDAPTTSVQTIGGTFSVAEYRKPVFSIEVAPARADVLAGEQIEATMTARYFAGGALANAPVRWRVFADPYFFASDSAPGYQFAAIDDADTFYYWFDNGPGYGDGEMVADGRATTDDQGRFTLRLPAELGDDQRSRTITVDVEVTDVDGQVIAGQGALTVHAGAFYIGLRPQGYVAQAGQPQKIDLITLDPRGQPVAGRALKADVYRREWYSVREQGPDGRFYFTSAYTDTLLQTIPAATDGQGRAEISFTPPAGGSYRIAASGKDDGGRAVQASAFTWASGGDVFWGIDDTNRIDLIADRTGYRPGDTAEILVTAPYPGASALLTIERGGVLEHRLLTIQGTSEILRVPITAAHAPNIYVSVVLIKPAAPGGNADNAPAVPDLRMGLINLPVATDQQELTIAVTPEREQAGPRDELTFTVKTTDHTGAGVPAEVALALVDKAVLALADDPNPSLLQAFYTRRPLGVFTSQSLTALVDRVTLRMQPGDKGGSGGGAGAESVLVRRDFPSTAYWNPALVTGADGTASVTVRLPDTLTTWRMTARGVTKDTLVGQGTQEIVATRPLWVRPALPRFLTVGDQLTVQAVVQNNTGSPIDATVTLSAPAQDGETVALRIDGAATQSVSVPANGQAVARWQATAPVAGTAVLRLSVAGGGQEDVVEHTLPIQRYATPETVASAGQVFDTTVETLRLPAGPPASGEVALELAPSLVAGMQGGLTYLETYPYGCTEQTVSTFMPNAATYRVLKQLGRDDAGLKASLERNLAVGLQRLAALQALDGGWGWWGGEQSNPYLTAYVVQGLNEAIKAGYGVDQAMLDRGVSFLKTALEDSGTGANDTGPAFGLDFSTLNTRAYILFVLGELGQPDRGRTAQLYDERAKLDLYGRAYLLMALKALGDEQRAGVLVGELASSAIMRPADAHWEEARQDYWTMSSDTRTTALALQALVRADASNILIPNAVRYLMSLREQSHWRTTQETAVTLIALAEYVAQSGELEADYSYRAALDGRTLREGAVNRDNLASSISLVIDLADLKAGADSQLAIQRQAAGGQSGRGRLYYTLRMRSFQDAASVQALDQGVGVRRDYIAVNTETLSPTGDLITQARLGDVVQVRLTLSVPEDMPYFMVEDMLPAGLEPLDTSLKTTSAAVRDPALAEAGEGAWPSWWYFGQTEIRDNRVALFATSLPRGTYTYTYLARATTAGVFQTLPAVAMRMYAPEVFGRSAGAQFTVTPAP